MPHLNGIEATRIILKETPHTKVLMLSGQQTLLYIKDSLKAGAYGYISKDASLSEITHAVKTIMQGKLYLWKHLPPTEENIILGFDSFTEREKEILHWIFLCKNNSYIMKIMHISLSTLHTYKYNMKKKVNAASDLEMLMLALKYRFLSLDGFNVKH